MNLDFKGWFYTEAGTSTASVAIFARPIFGGGAEVQRTWPDFWGKDDDEKKKKRKTEEQKYLH